MSGFSLRPPAFEILLVEDNPRDAELAFQALSPPEKPRRIIHVRDGQAALDFLLVEGEFAQREETPPRIVLLDLKLPKLDGLQVLRRIRADERTAQQPVVVLTSSREESDLAAAYALGVNSYIVKPIDFEVFTQALAMTAAYWLSLNEFPPLL